MRLSAKVHWQFKGDLKAIICTGGFYILLQISNGGVWQPRDLKLSRNTLYLLSPRLCISIVLNRDLFVIKTISRNDSLTS